MSSWSLRMYFLDPCSLELQCFSLKIIKERKMTPMTLELADCTVPANGTILIMRAAFFPMKNSEKLRKCHAESCVQGWWFIRSAKVTGEIQVGGDFGCFSPHQQSFPLCESVFNGSLMLPQARNTFRQWKIQSSPLCACKDKPFCLSCQSMVSLNYLRRNIFNDRMLLAWNLSCRLSWDFSLGYFLCLQPSLSGSRPWRTQPWP